MTVQLTDLDLDEISGVDHPANLHEGWLVMKADTEAGPLDAALTQVAEAANLTTTKEQTVDLHDAPEVETIDKAAEPVIDDEFRKEVSDLRKALADARAEAAAVKDERAVEKATARAHDWAIVPGVTPAEFGPVLKALTDLAPDQVQIIEDILDACTTALNEAGVLKELGTDATPDDESAWDRLNTLARSLVDAGRATTVEDGVAKAAAENPDLYRDYLNEIGA